MKIWILAPLALLALLAGLVACCKRAMLIGSAGIDCPLGQRW